MTVSLDSDVEVVPDAVAVAISMILDLLRTVG